MAERASIKPGLSAQVTIDNKVILKEQYINYQALSFLAESGGYVGIYLGLSIFDLVKTVIAWMSRTYFRPDQCVFILSKYFGV